MSIDYITAAENGPGSIQRGGVANKLSVTLCSGQRRREPRVDLLAVAQNAFPCAIQTIDLDCPSGRMRIAIVTDRLPAQRLDRVAFFVQRADSASA